MTETLGQEVIQLVREKKVASRYFYSDTDTDQERNLMGATNRARFDIQVV